MYLKKKQKKENVLKEETKMYLKKMYLKMYLKNKKNVHKEETKMYIKKKQKCT